MKSPKWWYDSKSCNLQCCDVIFTKKKLYNLIVLLFLEVIGNLESSFQSVVGGIRIENDQFRPCLCLEKYYSPLSLHCFE